MGPKNEDDDTPRVLIDPVARREAPVARDLFDADEEDELEEEVEFAGRARHIGGPLAVPLVVPRALVLSATDRREVCAAHGWVGRQGFQRDRHDLCAFDRRPCGPCQGTGYSRHWRKRSGICRACEGTGYAPRGAEDAAPAEVAAVQPARVEESSAPAVMLADRSGRNPAVPRPRSTAVKRLTRQSLRNAAQDLEQFTSSPEYAELLAQRPVTRGDCKAGQRPCPWVGCRHHLALNVNPATGTIQITFPGREIEDLPATCSLDVAEEGASTLGEIGGRMNLVRERVRQIELQALEKLHAAGHRLSGTEQTDETPRSPRRRRSTRKDDET